MRYGVAVGDRTLRVDASSDGRFLIDGEAVAAEVHESAARRQWQIRVGGRVHEVTVLTRDPLRLLVDGVEIEASAADERAVALSRAAGTRAIGRHEVRAPMPGLLKAVHVAEGDVVERDAPLVTLEAMKMENELRAPSRGRVTKLHGAAGTKVEGGAVLLILSAEEG